MAPKTTRPLCTATILPGILFLVQDNLAERIGRVISAALAAW
jgi:hypothetical protein